MLGAEKVTIIDEKKLLDGMEEFWDPSYIVQLTHKYMEANRVDGIISFDNYGVSGHPNHISVGMAIKLLRKDPKLKEVKMYELESVNLVRKFIGPLDFFFSAI